MRILFSFALIAFLATAFAQADAPANPAKTAASRVTSVTVYQNNALVTREVDVPEGVGPFELIVSPLPPLTVNSSLYSEGTDGIRVLTTRYRTRATKEDTREEVRKLESQLKELQASAQKLQADVKTVEQNLQMLVKLESFTSATMQHLTEKGVLNAESTISLAKYVMDTRTAKSKELVSLQQQLQANQEQSQFTQRKLQETAAGAGRTEHDAIIVVDKKNAPAGKVRLNYLVTSASWRPQYKFRAGKNKEAVQLEYLAAVVQQTGEDWSNVNVVLSTAQPMLNAAPPDLRTLEVAVVPRGSAAQSPTVMDKSGNVFFANAEKQTRQEFNMQLKELWARGNYAVNAGQIESGYRLQNSAAALAQCRELLGKDMDESKSGSGVILASGEEGPSVTYHLRTKLSVPSRNDEHVIEVARIEMAPEYFYKAVPVVTPHVYRQANLTNKSEYVLLPGEATMYIGTDFVGRTHLPLVAIGEQFTAGFGVDPQLQVQRQLVDKNHSTQGGNQVLRYDYRILISSYKAEPVKLQLWDRLPHAETQAVAITLVSQKPEISTDPLYLREDRPKNLLRWDLTVPPNTNSEKALAVNYEFKVELDRQMQIGTLTAK